MYQDLVNFFLSDININYYFYKKDIICKNYMT